MSFSKLPFGWIFGGIFFPDNQTQSVYNSKVHVWHSDILGVFIPFTPLERGCKRWQRGSSVGENGRVRSGRSASTLWGLLGGNLMGFFGSSFGLNTGLYARMIHIHVQARKTGKNQLDGYGLRSYNNRICSKNQTRFIIELPQWKMSCQFGWHTLAVLALTVEFQGYNSGREIQ